MAARTLRRSWSARSTSRARSARRSSAAASRMRFCSPGFAASAKRRRRGSSRDASIARRARRRSRAANARRASRFAPAARSTSSKSTAPLIARSMTRARSSRISATGPRATASRFTLSTRRISSPTQAFNALLKTLEEPPPHVKFILATTEPQKMPETILSRLQRYDFRRIPYLKILERLKDLAAREGVEVEEAALRLLAREAGGSMRDAERMLETAIASASGKVTEAEVASSLGRREPDHRVRALSEAIITRMRRRRCACARAAFARRQPRIARARFARDAAQSRRRETSRRRLGQPARRSSRS